MACCNMSVKKIMIVCWFKLRMQPGCKTLVIIYIQMLQKKVKFLILKNSMVFLPSNMPYVKG